MNLVEANREILCNTQQSNGFEVWRKINLLIFSRNEHRRGEFYGKINAPRAATGLADVPKAFEEWDTNQRLHSEVGGMPLRDDERWNLVMKVVPHVIREQLICNRDSFGSWDEVKDWIREKARQLVVYGGKSVPAHSLEDKGALARGSAAAEVLAVLSDDFMAKTAGWSFEEQILQLGVAATSEVILALIPRRAAWRGSGKKGDKGKKGGGKGKGGKGDRQTRCANCVSIDHESSKCPK